MSVFQKSLYMTAKYLVEYRFIKMLFQNLRMFLDRGLGVISRYLLFKLSRINPKRIFITTFQGDLTCNPKYITMELMKKHHDYQIVWGVRKDSIDKAISDLGDNIIVVPKYSFEFYRMLYTSKLCIINSGACLGRPFFKKKGQILFQTWHGSMGIKRIDPDTYTGKDRKFWVKMTSKTAKATEYMLANSTYENEIFRNSFWHKSEMLMYGHPRNDVLLNLSDKHMQKIKKEVLDRYSLDKDTKIILYAPTIRDFHSFECYEIPDAELTDALCSKYGGKWAIFKRMHPILRKYGKYYGYKNERVTCIDATDYPDMQDLLIASDIAVTDYSSWIYDFVLTKRPGFIYAVDIEKYNNGRGFYYSLQETPFPIASNGEELVKNILDFEYDQYFDRIEQFLVARGCVETGHASLRTVEKIHEIMKQ